MNRDDAREIAGRFLASQGAQTAGYRDAASFSYDDDAKTFLERELGLEKANQVLQLARASVALVLSLVQAAAERRVPRQRHPYGRSGRLRARVGGGYGAACDLRRRCHRRRATLPRRTHAPRFRRARIRRAIHGDPAPSHRPHIHLEVSRFRRQGRLLSRSKWISRATRSRATTNILKIPEQWTRDYKTVAIQERTGATIDTAVMGAAAAGAADHHRDPRAAAGCALAASVDHRPDGHDPLVLLQHELVSAGGVQLPHHRRLRQLRNGPVFAGGIERSGAGRLAVSFHGRR